MATTTFRDLAPTEIDAADIVGGPCTWAQFPGCLTGTTIIAFLHID